MVKPQIKIIHVDMSQDLQQEALRVASLAYNRYKDNSDMARYIKKEFEKRQEGRWNCIVGDRSHYMSEVTFKSNFYFRFSVGIKKITVFRSA